MYNNQYKLIIYLFIFDEKLQNNMKAIKPETGSFRDLENMDLNEKIKFLKTSKVPYKCLILFHFFQY
jgi:hypothetical protein